MQMTLARRLITPINILFIAVAIFSLHCAVLSYYGAWPTEISQKLWRFSFSFLVACWVKQDCRKRGLNAPFEFAAFMFFLWPILLPFHLFKTHRFKGLLIYLGILFMNFLPTILIITIELTLY